MLSAPVASYLRLLNTQTRTICDCGNDDEKSFHVVQIDSKNEWPTALACANQACKKTIAIGQVFDPIVQLLRNRDADDVICSKCRNNDPAQFKVIALDRFGFITGVKCLSCSDQISTVCHNSHWSFTKVEDMSLLRPGDHIFIRRPFLGYYHHGLVTELTDVPGRFKTLGYSDTSSISTEELKSVDKPPAFIAVREHEMTFGARTFGLMGALYKISYSECYNDEYTLLRASVVKGMTEYDVFKENCEHIVNWCKTGVKQDDHNQMQIIGKVIADASFLLFARLLTIIGLLVIYCVVLSRNNGNVEQLRTVGLSIMILFSILFVILYIAYFTRLEFDHVNRIVDIIEDSDERYCDRESGGSQRICLDDFVVCCQRYDRRLSDCSESCAGPCNSCCYGTFCRTRWRTFCYLVAQCFLGVLFCYLCHLPPLIFVPLARKLRCSSKPTWCGRPRTIAAGILLRVCVREVVSALGPTVVFALFVYGVPFLAPYSLPVQAIITFLIAAAVSIPSQFVGQVLGSTLAMVLCCN